MYFNFIVKYFLFKINRIINIEKKNRLFGMKHNLIDFL